MVMSCKFCNDVQIRLQDIKEDVLVKGKENKFLLYNSENNLRQMFPW